MGCVARFEPELDVFGFQVLEMFTVVHAAVIGCLCILDQLQSPATFMKVYEFTKTYNPEKMRQSGEEKHNGMH